MFWPHHANISYLRELDLFIVIKGLSDLVTLAFYIKGANLTLEVKLYQNFHHKCPASASHGIVNIMAAPNLSSEDEGVGGLGMSFVGQPHRPDVR